MSESEEAEDLESIDFSNLSDEQQEALASHPQVRKMLEYEETSIPQIVGMLSNLIDEEYSEDNDTTYTLLVEGIAERSGRVTESTVHKVFSGFVEEYNAVK